jgi:NADH:ubiquinone oxidoreductase subunit
LVRFRVNSRCSSNAWKRLERFVISRMIHKLANRKTGWQKWCAIQFSVDTTPNAKIFTTRDFCESVRSEMADLHSTGSMSMQPFQFR